MAEPGIVYNRQAYQATKVLLVRMKTKMSVIQRRTLAPVLGTSVVIQVTQDQIPVGPEKGRQIKEKIVGYI